jgi:hypothetical protein
MNAHLYKERKGGPPATKTWDSGTFTLTGFDSDFLEELYCNKHRPPE